MTVSRTVAEGDVLTAEQARRLIALPKSTFYELVRLGRIAHYRVPSPKGGRALIRVHRADITAFLEGARQAATRVPVRVDVDGLLRKVRRG